MHPWACAWIPLAGTAVALTAVGPHCVFDDYVLGLIARAEPAIAGLKQDRFDLFTFTTGLASDNRALMDQGVMLPWWSDQTLQVAFFRPLSSLFHRLDYLLWPASPKLMYLHSLAWLGLLLGAAAGCYRRLESSPLLAGLAALLLAVDDTHGASAGESALLARQYLDRISERQRMVVILRHGLEYSIEEIAEMTGISQNTVKDRLLRARGIMRRMFRREQFLVDVSGNEVDG